MKTRESLIKICAAAIALATYSANAQSTVFIGGGAGDATADVPASTWIRSDGPTGNLSDWNPFIGGIADTHDFHGVLSFDLSQLAGATAVSSVTIRFPQEGSIHTNNTGSINSVAVTLTELTVAATNAATWNTYDGTNAWTTPGGTGDTVGSDFTSNTFDMDLLVEDDAGTATIVIPSSAALEALILANAGGQIDFLWRVPLADGGATLTGRNFLVFDGASGGGSEGSLDSSPQIEVTFEGSPDPVLTQDIVNGDPDLAFGTTVGALPIVSTRTVRFDNDGPTNDIEVTSATIDIVDVFTISDIAVNGVGGQSLPTTLNVGDYIEISVEANAAASTFGATATLDLVTDEISQDESLPISGTFIATGEKLNPNPLLESDVVGWGGGPSHVSPGLASGSTGMMRIKGQGDPVAGAPDSAFQAAGIVDGIADWQVDFYFSPINVTNFASYVDPDGSLSITGPDGAFSDRTFQWVLLGTDANPPNPDYGDTQAANTIINLAYMPDGVQGATGAPDFYVFDGVNWVATGMGAILGSIDLDTDADPLNGMGNGNLDVADGDTINAYRMTITGTGFGTGSASFDITVSGGELGAPLTATSLTTFHAMDGDTTAPAAHAFTTADLASDSNAGDDVFPGFVTPFWVDDACVFAGTRPDPDMVVLSAPVDLTVIGSSGVVATSATIRNDGTSTLTGTASLVGTGFTVTSPLGISLASGATQVFNIEFDASSVTLESLENATLTLATNDLLEPSVDLDFTGIATLCLDIGSGGVPFALGGTSEGVTAFGWVRSNDSTALKGGTTSFIGTTDGIALFWGYVGFDLTSFSPTDTISAATVSIYSQGADTFDANGPSTTDANDIDMLLTGWTGADGVTGFGSETGGTATVNGGVNDGLPANWDNFNTFYGATVATAASVNLDTLAVEDEIQFDVTAAIQAAITAGESSVSFGITSPEAIATNARNFFAISGVAENGAAGNDIAPNLKVTLVEGGGGDPIVVTNVSRNGSGDIIIDFTGTASTVFDVRKSLDLLTSPFPTVITAQNAPVTTSGAGVGQAIIDSADAADAAAFYQLTQP